MKLPSYERQNKWMRDYIQPIFNLDFGAIVNNYKHNKREALRSDMEVAGVFESLKRLDSEGTSFEKLTREMREQIDLADVRKDPVGYKAYIGLLDLGAKYLGRGDELLKEIRESPAGLAVLMEKWRSGKPEIQTFYKLHKELPEDPKDPYDRGPRSAAAA